MSSARCMQRKRRLDASPQQRLIRPATCKPVNFQGAGAARPEPHAGCRPAASSSQRPEWNATTKVPATFDKFCSKETLKRERVIRKATRKSGRFVKAVVKMDPKEATEPRPPGDMAPLMLPDYSFLFKKACFSPNCSDAGHFQCWPLKKARRL
ncbi:uncharacterized protein LOC142570025 [Dermacentor variabilis]|uniref:uncharacterized protein LOC142570025 n=1 Tax=Dermacentor variabilis TaxID=34621 RepID=UPI003F5C8BA5